MITIRQPLNFSEIGRKENQEDFLYPSAPDKESRVFILCDGMGGHDNGEVASMTVGTTLGNYLDVQKEITEDVFGESLAKAYDALDEIDTFTSKKPGTTLTCLCINPDNCLVAHIGDSRIYHIRPSLFNRTTRRGGILYQSSDHSLVNELLKAGEITEEEARDFPQKNVITRALQPHLPKRYKADTYVFDNIEDGDYFFMCSDGALEQLSNESLCSILADRKKSDQEKLRDIAEICQDKTRDNYSCWLIPIDRVKLSDGQRNLSVIKADAETCEENNSDNEKKPKSLKISIPLPLIPDFKKFSLKRLLLIFAVVLVLIACAYIAWKILFGKDPTGHEDIHILSQIIGSPKAI